MENTHTLLFGKMSPAHSPAITGVTFNLYSKKSQKPKFQCLDLTSGQTPEWFGGGAADISWRVMDAQYWGVAQRRKRIVLVADYTTQRSAEILFIPEGVSRHPTQSSQQGQGTARASACDFGKTGIRLCGIPLNCRPENMYELDEKSSTLCNGTNP